MFELLLSVLPAVGGLVFFLRRIYRYLQFFQQEEYDNSRYWKWLIAHKVFDRKGSIACISAALLAYTVPKAPLLFIISAMAVFALIQIAYTEDDPRKVGKITLKMTDRATRMLRVSTGIFLILQIVALWLFSDVSLSVRWLLQALFIQMTPVCLMAAKLVLQPDENARQAKFLKEAKDNLARVNPTVIGITGSYGKTSTKMFLGKLLEGSVGATFYPPRSINTPMGIVRELRERLRPGHKFAVIEMGAYQIGSIARLCAITPPRAAIVTAVGICHLERFGSKENVYLAKSELPQAVPQTGILVCNGDNPGARQMATEFRKATTLLYGLEASMGPLDCSITDVRLSADGSDFKIHWKNQTFDGFTRLHGRPALSNILAAFTLAAALGADPQYLLAAIRTLEPFDNRLEVKNIGKSLQINDAYNSNPDGFLAALEVLQALPGKRRILVTPGMIELGDQQATENERVAEVAAKICDIIFVVGETNRQALESGISKAGFPAEQLHYYPSRDAALNALQEIRTPEDIVLLENDLPDLYEVNTRF